MTSISLLFRIYIKTKESEALKAAEKLRKNLFNTKFGSVGGEEPSGQYSSFDQEYQHVLFWGFVRDGKWDTVEAFLDKKVSKNFEDFFLMYL